MCQFMESEVSASPCVQPGCCIKICLRLLSPLKVHLVCLEVWIDVLMANSCSRKKRKKWKITQSPPARQSPSLSNLSTRVSECVSPRVCEWVSAPLLALHWRDWTGGRSRLCGLLPFSFNQSKSSGKWRRCIKTWPGQQRGMDAVYQLDEL